VKKAPLGVTVVAVLTLLGAIGDFFFATVWVAFSGMGSAGVYVSPPISYWIVLFNSLLLSIISLVASVGMFQGARYVWYLSIILWEFSAAHYCYAAWCLMFRGENLMIMTGLAILVNITLIVYFQSKQVLDYFLDHQTG
jgi:hypothetical protein